MALYHCGRNIRGTTGAGHSKHPEVLGESAKGNLIRQRPASEGSCHVRHRFQASEVEP